MTQDQLKFAEKYLKLTIKTASIMMVGAFAGLLALTSDKIARGLAAFGLAIEIVSVIIVMLRGMRAMDSVAPPRPKRREAHLERAKAARFFSMVISAVFLSLFSILSLRLFLEGDSVFSYRGALAACGFFAALGIISFLHWLFALEVEEDAGEPRG